MDEFRKCVLGGTSMVSRSPGFPDGNPSPAVTLDLKVVYVLTPSTGKKTLSFAIAPNANGTFVMLDGDLTTSYNYNGFAGWLGTAVNGWSTSFYAAGTAYPVYGAIPDARLSSIQVGWGSQTAGQVTSGFRPIVSVADVEYTGTPLYAAGSVRVSSVPLRFVKTGMYPYTYGTTSSGSAANHESRSTDQFLGNIFPNTIVLPARKSFTTRVLAPHGPYADTANNVYEPVSGSQSIWGFAHDPLVSTAAPGPVYYPDTTVKVISYTGLDSSASVTVTLRYCVQTTVGLDNALFNIAKPSPPSDPASLSWYDKITSMLPTVDTLASIAKVATRIAMPSAGQSGFPALRDDL